MTSIKVENLSKLYRLGEIGTGTLSLDLERWWRMKILKQEDPYLKIGEANDRSTKGTSDIVYALRDINFEIEQGDAVGIIGKNGAGKSTLLKILSRVTAPSTGKIHVKGRIASLLEVGTGFHPELTGRENIYLNGAILGMRKKEIDRKLDEIIDFSGVERYIDTPVKRYSSGMYVRLAFAVAAHLESEILIVDEVLAVGDAEFQKKCLGKMVDISKGEGRTVLFVSHNMAAVSALCSRSIVLKNGTVDFIGDVERGIDHYMNYATNVKGYSDLSDKKSSMWKHNALFSKLISIETVEEKNNRQSLFKMGGQLKIKIEFEIFDDRKDIEIGVFIRGYRENIIGLCSSAAEGFKINIKGKYNSIVNLTSLKLMPGEYKIGVWIVHQRVVDVAYENAINIDVISNNFTGNFVDYERFKGYGYLMRSTWT